MSIYSHYDSIWNNRDWQEDRYYSPTNKQELLEKQKRLKDLRERFPEEFTINSGDKNV